ncbi:MAG: hypothetical protein ACP5UZ_08705 [Thermoplasmata archaeon]
MVRKSVLENCKICGLQARRISYYSRAKGRIYHYYKYVHSNGTVHYFRRNPQGDESSTAIQQKRPVVDLIEEIISVRMRDRKLTFSEIRSLLRDVYNQSFSSATIYRGIDRLRKLNLIEKETMNGHVFYKRKFVETQTGNLKTTRMSIGLVQVQDTLCVTILSRFRNVGLGLVTEFGISLPMTGGGSIDQLSLTAYDEIGPIVIMEKNILFSAPDQTAVMVPFNQPLRQSEENSLFMTFTSKFGDSPFKMAITSEIEYLKVSCKIRREEELKVERLLLDGLKRIEPKVVRRTATDPDYLILETEFEGLSRGDTILVSPAKS